MNPRWLPILVCLLLASPAAAQLEDELDERPALTRVRLEAPPYLVAGQPFELRVVFDVPRGYHIYGPLEKRWVPTAVRVAGARDIVWSKPVYPPAKVKKIPDLGPAAIYEGRVVLRVAGQVAAHPALGARALRVEAAWGTCNDQLCKESRFLGRNPYVLQAAAPVLLSAPQISAPRRVARGKPFVLYAAIDVPEEHHLEQPSVTVAPAAGIRWGRPALPAEGKHRGKLLIKIPGTVDSTAKRGARELQVTLGWRTAGARGVQETVRDLRLTLRIEVADHASEERVTTP